MRKPRPPELLDHIFHTLLDASRREVAHVAEKLPPFQELLLIDELALWIGSGKLSNNPVVDTDTAADICGISPALDGHVECP